MKDGQLDVSAYPTGVFGLDGYEIHGIGCYGAWGLLSFLMVVTGRHLKNFPKLRMMMHCLLGLTLLAVSLIFTEYAKVGSKNRKHKTHSVWSHKYYGEVTNNIAIAVCALGAASVVLNLLVSIVPRTNSAVWWIPKLMRMAHILLSYFVIVWANYVLLSGMYSYDSGIKYFMFLHFSAYVLGLIVLELIRQV